MAEDFRKTEEANLMWARTYVDSLSQVKFWGKLTLTYQDGVVTHASEDKTTKPPRPTF